MGKKRKIVDATRRGKKLKRFVNHAKAVMGAYGVSEKSKLGIMLAGAMMTTEYQHNDDPVIYIAILRADLNEITRFVTDCETQLGKFL